MDNTRCPLCGRANRCTQVLPQTVSQPCWCFTVRIAAEVLQRVPPALLDQSCLCPECAQAVRDDQAGAEAAD